MQNYAWNNVATPLVLTLGYYLAVCVLWTWVCFRHYTGDMELVLAINMPFLRK